MIPDADEELQRTTRATIPSLEPKKKTEPKPSIPPEPIFVITPPAEPEPIYEPSIPPEPPYTKPYEPPKEKILPSIPPEPTYVQPREIEEAPISTAPPEPIYVKTLPVERRFYELWHEDPATAMEYAYQQKLVTKEEYYEVAAGVRERSYFQHLWERDPYVALEYAKQTGLISKPQYKQELTRLEKWEEQKIRRERISLESAFRQWEKKPPPPTIPTYWGTGFVRVTPPYTPEGYMQTVYSYPEIKVIEPPKWEETTLTGQLITHLEQTEVKLREIHPWLADVFFAPTSKISPWPGVDIIKGAEVTGITIGRIAGVYTGLQPPEPISALISTVYTPGKEWWQFGELHAPKPTPALEEYQKLAEKHPAMVIGDISYIWLESVAIGWAAGKIGGRIAKTRWGIKAKGKLLKTLKPERVEITPKIAGLKEKLPGFIRKRFWPLEYGREQLLKKAISWGGAEQYYGWVPDIELTETLSPHWKYTGYPVIEGPKAGYKIIKVGAPTAWQQLQKAIEMGKFKAMGGLPAQQIVSFTRAEIPSFLKTQAHYLGVVFAEAPAKGASIIGPLTAAGYIVTKGAAGYIVTKEAAEVVHPQVIQPTIRPVEIEKFKPQLLLEPGLKEEEDKFVPIPSIPFEIEKVKFRTVELLAPKVKKREKPVVVPKLHPYQPQVPWVGQIPAQIQKLDYYQIQVPRLTPVQPPWHPSWPPTPTPTPVPPPPVIPPFKWPEKVGGGIFGYPKGRWKFRLHPIATAAQVAKGLTYGEKSFVEMVSFPRKRIRRRRRRR